MKRFYKIIPVIFLLVGLLSLATCNRLPEPLRGFATRIGTIAASAPPEPQPVRLYTFNVVNTFLHDPRAYTQGLVFLDGFLYEGTGWTSYPTAGGSSLRKVNLATGEVIQKRDLAPRLFGEGIAIFANRIYQLTWKAGLAFVYDKESFELQGQFTYPTEGWGLTHDGKRLIMSDGTANIYFRDPETFEEIGRIQVTDGGLPITNLNELEYIQGEIYANIWLTDRIARINPKTGAVISWIDLTGLLSPQDRLTLNRQEGQVLNGIAYNQENGRLFVTGKQWPKLFEIELLPKE